MPVLPQSDILMIEWFEQRIAAWSGNAAAIGLDLAQTTELLSRAAAARVVYQTAQGARNTSKSATVAFHDGSDNLRGFGADLIKTIKAFAETTEDPNVYVLSDVPPPADPIPLGPPGTPYNMTTTLNNAGHLLLTWKADNASASTGAYFMLQRRLDTEQSFTLLGGVGTKSFTDVKVPLGTSQAIYIITPHRADLVGQPSNQVVVQFGVNIPSPGQENSGEGGLNIAA